MTKILAPLILAFKEKDASILQSTVTTTTLAQLTNALMEYANISLVVMIKILALLNHVLTPNARALQRVVMTATLAPLTLVTRIADAKTLLSLVTTTIQTQLTLVILTLDVFTLLSIAMTTIFALLILS
jgi:hypothetical protein